MAASDERVRELARVCRAFNGYVALNQAMGMVIGDLADGSARMLLPWDDRWLGDEPERLVHGGVLSALLDAACGLAAFMGMKQPGTIATLDLRIDHLRAAAAGVGFEADAIVVRSSKSVLFVRGTAYQGDPEAPVAVATATFAVTA